MGEDMEGSHFFPHGDVDSYSGASGRRSEVKAESSEDNDEETCSNEDEQVAEFTVQVQKHPGEALGISFVEQGDAVLIEGVYDGVVKQ